MYTQRDFVGNWICKSTHFAQLSFWIIFSLIDIDLIRGGYDDDDDAMVYISFTIH